jgi:8-oxo-dGTP pyrophosphatase MutT (NUDIX family)
LADADIPIRPAATVLLVRDRHDGLEVFMLQRNLRSAFVPGVYLFPGGGLDPADGEGDGAYRIAAIRECFEEAGVLLAYGRDGQILRLARDDIARRFEGHRAAMNAGHLGFHEMCDREGLTPATGALVPFGHWVTPPGAPRRYDTRFFITEAPPQQTPFHDDVETIAHAWIRPTDALARFERKEIELIYPTEMSLRAMASFDDAGDLLAAAGAA